MRFLTRLIVLFFVSLGLIEGSFLLLFSMKQFSFHMMVNLGNMIYTDQTLRTGVGVFAGVLLFMNYLFYQFFSVNVHKEKIIAFDHPSGRVSVSLVAIEDMVRRRLSSLPEMKDAKVKIVASKDILKVTIRLMLVSEVNIRDITFNIQNMVKRKIQDTIGIEQPIDVAVYVGKIVSEYQEPRHSKDKKDAGPSAEPAVPYQGYRS